MSPLAAEEVERHELHGLGCTSEWARHTDSLDVVFEDFPTSVTLVLVYNDYVDGVDWEHVEGHVRLREKRATSSSSPSQRDPLPSRSSK